MSDEKKENDLFNNPMVDMARKAMTPEQQAEYKKMGEYMYKTEFEKINAMGATVKEPTEEELIMYAVGMLRSGGDPMDLSDQEIRGLISMYGSKWYTEFDLKPEEVPKPFIETVGHDELIDKLKKDVISRVKNVQKRKKKKGRKPRI